MKNVAIAGAIILAGGLALAGPFDSGPESRPAGSRAQSPAVQSSMADGDRAFEQRDYAGAILYYTRAVELDRLFVRAYVRRAWSYLRLGAGSNQDTGDLDKALNDVSMAMTIDPSDKGLFHLRGKILMSKAYFPLLAGRRQEGGSLQDRAMADYQAALAADPGSPAILVDIGNAYAAKGDPDRALAVFAGAYERTPDEPLLRPSLEALFGEFERRRRDFDCGKAPRTWLAAGEYFAGKSRFDVAVACYSRALALGWAGDTIHMLRSVAYAGLGRLDLALADANEDVRRNPDGYAYANRGRLYEKKSDLVNALSDLSTAVTLAEKEPVKSTEDYRNGKLLEFRMIRARVLGKLGSWDEAVKDLAFVDRYLLPGAAKAEVNYELAKAYQNKGDAKAAKRYDRIARKMDPALKK